MIYDVLDSLSWAQFQCFISAIAQKLGKNLTLLLTTIYFLFTILRGEGCCIENMFMLSCSSFCSVKHPWAFLDVLYSVKNLKRTVSSQKLCSVWKCKAAVMNYSLSLPNWELPKSGKMSGFLLFLFSHATSLWFRFNKSLISAAQSVNSSGLSLTLLWTIIPLYFRSVNLKDGFVFF